MGRKNTILFDLGGTLAAYYDHAQFPAILAQAIARCEEYLSQRGLLHVPPEAVRAQVELENHESPDYRVRPLEERLGRIFHLNLPDANPHRMGLCRAFLEPIIALGRCYEDTLPTLQRLAAEGYRLAIVSNTPWGSPAALWHAEVARLGLAGYVQALITCRDAGWRKPASPIFQLTLDRLGAAPAECLFVGDDPRWDIAGPRALGISALLIARYGATLHPEEHPIASLHALWDRL